MILCQGPAGTLSCFGVLHICGSGDCAGVFALQKNVFRQLPLYRFLEGQAVEDLQRQDQETYEKLVESNTRYLGKMVREENRDARVTPEITEKLKLWILLKMKKDRR